jgi:single-strand DNA-binding protein
MHSCTLKQHFSIYSFYHFSISAFTHFIIQTISTMQTMKNSVSLMGYLGSDVQSFTLNTGRKVAKARLATNEYYKDKNGQRAQHTEWHNLTGWGPVADRMEKQLSKGMQVVVEGKLVHRSYEDKNGNTRYMSEIVVSSFLTTKEKEGLSVENPEYVAGESQD